MENLHTSDVSGFNGKVLLVYLIRSPEAFAGGIVVGKPQIEELWGHTFLTGIVSGVHDWSRGSRIAIRFDQIGHFVEFESEQEFVQRSLGSTTQ